MYLKKSLFCFLLFCVFSIYAQSDKSVGEQPEKSPNEMNHKNCKITVMSTTKTNESETEIYMLHKKNRSQCKESAKSYKLIEPQEKEIIKKEVKVDWIDKKHKH